jgi:phage-related protein
MAYNNPFWYNRDVSSKASNKYDIDLTKSNIDNTLDEFGVITDFYSFLPTYGSSVSFSSRLNYLQTVDNALKILPSSENNLTIKYNLKFLLSNDETATLLKTIEIAGGYKYLKFKDPSSIYKDIVGLVEDYSIVKQYQNLNEFNLTVSSYIKSPLFNWRTSSILILSDSYFDQGALFLPTNLYNKYDIVYNEIGPKPKNKIDYFWFANKASIGAFSLDNWSKNFIFETKLPFELKNKFDIYQMDSKNSFIQNIKHKNNSNALKQYEVKFENIEDSMCKSILFFLEKKCGYRRFIYEFPIYLDKNKVFICINWNHTFKYKNCNDLNMIFVEDPNPNIYIDNTIVDNPQYYVI